MLKYVAGYHGDDDEAETDRCEIGQSDNLDEAVKMAIDWCKKHNKERAVVIGPPGSEWVDIDRLPDGSYKTKVYNTKRKVFYCKMLQGAGEDAVCRSEERAKEWVKEAIIRHQGGEDADPWKGWAWYRDKEGNLCFGGQESVATQDPYGEGYVKEFEVLI